MQQQFEYFILRCPSKSYGRPAIEAGLGMEEVTQLGKEGWKLNCVSDGMMYFERPLSLTE